jgi:hypothetical protein
MSYAGGCCALVLLLPLGVATQTPEVRYDIPPAVPPSSCGLSLATLSSITGPPAYRRLAYQLRALESAEEAVTALQAGMKGLTKEQSPALGMSDLFTGTKQAHEALLCSASIVSKYVPVDDTDNTSRTLLIVAYNQEAAAIADLEAHSKEQFLRSEAEKTQAMQVKDAERMTAINLLQSEAASSLAEITTLSLLQAVDDSNPAATNTRQTLIPCSQYPNLLKESTALAQQTKSAYTTPASLFVKFLGGHRCK